jgi:hypothetical protein
MPGIIDYLLKIWQNVWHPVGYAFSIEASIARERSWPQSIEEKS